MSQDQEAFRSAAMTLRAIFEEIGPLLENVITESATAHEMSLERALNVSAAEAYRKLSNYVLNDIGKALDKTVMSNEQLMAVIRHAFDDHAASFYFGKVDFSPRAIDISSERVVVPIDGKVTGTHRIGELLARFDRAAAASSAEPAPSIVPACDETSLASAEAGASCPA